LMKKFQSCLNLHLTKTLVIQKEEGDLEDEIQRSSPPLPVPRERSLSEVRMYINTSGLKEAQQHSPDSNNNSTSTKNMYSLDTKLQKLKNQFQNGERSKNKRREVADTCKALPSYMKQVIMREEYCNDLNLPCTAREMREILGSKKRRDPRIINKMDFRRKLEIVQTL